MPTLYKIAFCRHVSQIRAKSNTLGYNFSLEVKSTIVLGVFLNGEFKFCNENPVGRLVFPVDLSNYTLYLEGLEPKLSKFVEKFKQTLSKIFFFSFMTFDLLILLTPIWLSSKRLVVVL